MIDIPRVTTTKRAYDADRKTGPSIYQWTWRTAHVLENTTVEGVEQHVHDYTAYSDDRPT
jgi:hypothetical protein